MRAIPRSPSVITLSRIAPVAGLPMAVTGQFPGGGSAFVQAWFGNVDMSGPFGNVPLGPGMGGYFGPAGGPGGFNLFAAFSHSSGTETFLPFYSGWGTGSGVGTKPGSVGGRGFRNDLSALRQQTTSFFHGPPRGAMDVIVQSAPVSGGGGTSSSTLAASALGLAAARQPQPQELLGRHFFGPRYQVDLVALAHDGGALGGGWLRTSAIHEDFYGEIGLQALTDFDGSDDLRISDLFVVNRRGDTDIIAGRQRWLEGVTLTVDRLAESVGIYSAVGILQDQLLPLETLDMEPGDVYPVQLEPREATLYRFGDPETVQLAVLALDSAAQSIGYAAITYESSNTSVATVDANGLVSAAGPGAAMITVTATTATGTASAQCAVEVIDTGDLDIIVQQDR